MHKIEEKTYDDKNTHKKTMSSSPPPPWSHQMIEIKSRDGMSMKAFVPLLKFRWQLFNKTPGIALKKLSQLPSNTVQVILEHLYANTPVSRTNLPAFKACKIVDSIPFVSSYQQDILNLLHDISSCDFEFIAANGESTLPVHKFILASRCHYFKDLFQENPREERVKAEKMNSDALQMFAEYIYVGSFTVHSVPALLELYGAGFEYGLRDPEEIDYLATYELKHALNSENIDSVRAHAEEVDVPADVLALLENFSFEEEGQESP